MSQSPVVMLNPSDGHWPILRNLVESAGAAGNLTTDAHLAALTMEYDATLYSTDADFRRFPSLKLRNPID